MSERYILDDEGNPVECEDLLEWAQWLENATNRVVAQETIGDSQVSTVFLGLDHSFGGGPPLLYETLVFGGPLADEQERYSSREEAVAGHARMIEKVKQ